MSTPSYATMDPDKKRMFDQASVDIIRQMQARGASTDEISAHLTQLQTAFGLSAPPGAAGQMGGSPVQRLQAMGLSGPEAASLMQQYGRAPAAPPNPQAAAAQMGGPPQQMPPTVRLEPQIDDSTIMQTSARPAPKRSGGMKWLNNQNAVQSAAFTLMGKARMQAGEGKGKWIPFSALSGGFQDQFAKETGGAPPPAGWWSGDLSKRERQLATWLAAEGVKEKQYMAQQNAGAASPRDARQAAALKARTMAPSGPVNPRQREIAAFTQEE